MSWHVKIDRTGQVFSRWTVLGYVVGSRPVKMRLRCACGTQAIRNAQHVYDGSSRSCGCLQREQPWTRHGLLGRPEYVTWQGMKARCMNPRAWNYRYYGGRGISICDRWRSDFAAFFADMGPKPSPKHSIDRIDVNGNYEPGNCRWATSAEQTANKRPSRAPALQV